jgi:hypothetical protein
MLQAGKNGTSDHAINLAPTKWIRLKTESTFILA